MIGISCIFEFSALGKCGCSILLFNNLEYVCLNRQLYSYCFLSLSCLESQCFSATFREILLPSSGKVCE